MTLISMLLALVIERLSARGSVWQSYLYSQAYFRLSKNSVLNKLAQHKIGQYFWLILPGAVLTLLLCLLDNRLITFAVNTLVLLLAFGCMRYRTLYKQYLNAKEREDQEAAFLVIRQIRQQLGSQQQSSDGQLLLWLNFRYYAAVLFWFALLGAFGVITYVLLRQLQETPENEQDAATQLALRLTSEQQTAEEVPETVVAGETATTDETAVVTEPLPEAEPVSEPATATVKKDAVDYLSHWADFFPVRLFGLGLALVGYFSKATSSLLNHFLDFTVSNEQVITDVAAAAEPLPAEVLNTPEETSAMVQLAKRNILFFLALTAILTLGGWLG